MRSQRLIASWIIFSFVLWVFAFRGFLSSRFALISDALSYYDHTKFFIENLGRGVYPLWDPFWFNGSPNDFFLRRIGAFNPFYLVLVLMKCAGIPVTLAYLWFLAGYYWSGMIAFYLLAKRVYHDQMIAYAGYLILLFSALGTRLFDSYMMLVTVPLIWFFYFLTAFSQEPRKHFFLGLVLFSMILAGTYIPIYSLIIISLFLVLFALVYVDLIPEIFGRWAQFFKQNKILVLSSFVVLIFSFLPVLSFFHDSARGQVVMPVRHGDASMGQALTVPHQTLDWGVVEDLMYSFYFSDLRLFKAAVVYVPFWAVILVILGFAGRISRRAILLFLTGIVLFCLIVPHGFPFYDFFYAHVFFLKYFRNLHFFIWFFLIPLFVFFALEQWKLFSDIKPSQTRERNFLLIYILAVHLTVLLFVWWRKDAVASTYIMITLSFVFFSLMALKPIQSQLWKYALLTLMILVQPLQAYYYFSLKALHRISTYEYDFPTSAIQLTNNGFNDPDKIPTGKQSLYYVAGEYNKVYQNTSNYALAKYLQNKFILVDRLVPVSRDAAAAMLERHFISDDDSAVVFKEKASGLKLTGNDPNPPPQALRVRGENGTFRLLSFDANHVRVALNFPYEKFLIFNDTYDPYWHLTINHHPAPVIEVNGAFKGTWVPAGQSVVEFGYGIWWQYAMNILLSFCALIFLAGIIFYASFS